MFFVCFRYSPSFNKLPVSSEQLHRGSCCQSSLPATNICTGQTGHVSAEKTAKVELQNGKMKSWFSSNRTRQKWHVPVEKTAKVELQNGKMKSWFSRNCTTQKWHVSAEKKPKFELQNGENEICSQGFSSNRTGQKT